MLYIVFLFLTYLSVCLYACVYGSQRHMWVPGTGLGPPGLVAGAFICRLASSLFFLNPNSPFYLLIETKPKYSQYFKIKSQNHFFSYCYLWGLLCSVTISTKKWRRQGGVCKRAQILQQCYGTALPFISPILSLK